MNEHLLVKVRALLAKAESTEYPHEAEALNLNAAEQSGAPRGMSTALVLRDRVKLVRDEFAGMFPNITHQRASVRSQGGYTQGRRAGERADLGATRLSPQRDALRAGTR